MKDSEGLDLLVFEIRTKYFGVDPEEVLGIKSLEECDEGTKLIDICSLWALSQEAQGSRSKARRVLLVPSGRETIGLIVDSVKGIERLAQNELKPLPPIIKETLSSGSVLGVGRLGEELLILLDLYEIVKKH